MRRHCESLARHGWRVYQLGLGAEGEDAVGRLNGVVLVRWRRPRYRGRRILRYVRSYVEFFVWARRLLRRLARRRRVDVIQVNNLPNFMVWSATGARRLGSAVVLDMHDPEPELFVSKWGAGFGARGGRRILEAVEWWAARSADRTLCVHEPMRRLLEARGTGSGRLTAVVNAPDAALFPALPARSNGQLVYHGTVAHRMGLDVVIRAAMRLRERGRSITLAILGDGDAAADLQRLVRENVVASWVSVPGRRFRLEEVLSVLREAGGGIVPVRRDTFTDVMLPTKLLEYARLGVPAAVTWTPTIAHYFPDDSVYFIEEFTVDGVVAVLERMLDRPEEARARATRAQTLPIARAWQDIEREYLALIEHTARKRRTEDA